MQESIITCLQSYCRCLGSDHQSHEIELDLDGLFVQQTYKASALPANEWLPALLGHNAFHGLSALPCGLPAGIPKYK